MLRTVDAMEVAQKKLVKDLIESKLVKLKEQATKLTVQSVYRKGMDHCGRVSKDA
jgi:hypothetical protein